MKVGIILILLFIIFGLMGSVLMDADHFIDYYNNQKVGIKSITSVGHRPLHIPIFVFVSFLLVFVWAKEIGEGKER
jgi:hypothetical protein